MRALNIYCFAHPHGEVYHDDLVYLGEGLEALGHKLYGNRDLWLRTPGADDWLIHHDPRVSYHECDMVLVAGQYFEYLDETAFSVTRATLSSEVFQTPRRFATIFLDINDGWKTIAWEASARNFDIILRTKLNSRCSYPSNLKPWAQGVSGRVRKMAESAVAFENRSPCVLDNFGFTHDYPHAVREWARKTVYPKLPKHLPVELHRSARCTDADGEWNWLMNKQTKGKHHPAYYKDLGGSQVVSCFCGEWFPSRPHDAAVFSGGGKKVALCHMVYAALDHLIGASPRLIQWDSWRFWETLTCGAAALHCDLTIGGVSLPVMPVPGVHYVACDSRGRIPEDWLTGSALRRISLEGRAWAEEHYSPRKAAERMMSYL